MIQITQHHMEPGIGIIWRRVSYRCWYFKMFSDVLIQCFSFATTQIPAHLLGVNEQKVCLDLSTVGIVWSKNRFRYQYFKSRTDFDFNLFCKWFHFEIRIQQECQIHWHIDFENRKRFDFIFSNLMKLLFSNDFDSSSKCRKLNSILLLLN